MGPEEFVEKEGVTLSGAFLAVLAGVDETGEEVSSKLM
jgi:hypothetical protein